ncbi:hypothetical protein GCM10025861_16530 [Methanobacterium petrolearium]|nr:hypothetical protein GCM10025861_16530 [Methanobacterium petrolearium]
MEKIYLLCYKIKILNINPNINFYKKINNDKNANKTGLWACKRLFIKIWLNQREPDFNRKKYRYDYIVLVSIH